MLAGAFGRRREGAIPTLPLLSLNDNRFHQQYSSARYMDWPGAFNPLWTAWGPSLILFLQHGYLKLRK